MDSLRSGPVARTSSAARGIENQSCLAVPREKVADERHQPVLTAGNGGSENMLLRLQKNWRLHCPGGCVGSRLLLCAPF